MVISIFRMSFCIKMGEVALLFCVVQVLFVNINLLCRNTSSSWKKQRNMTTDWWVQNKSFSFVIHSGTLRLTILCFATYYS